MRDRVQAQHLTHLRGLQDKIKEVSERASDTPSSTRTHPHTHTAAVYSLQGETDTRVLRLQRLASLRNEADQNATRAEESVESAPLSLSLSTCTPWPPPTDAFFHPNRAEAANKKLEHELMTKDQEIVSLQHRIANLEADLEKAEAKLAEAKGATEDVEGHRTENEILKRKVDKLEEDLDNQERQLRETTDKCVVVRLPPTEPTRLSTFWHTDARATL